MANKTITDFASELIDALKTILPDMQDIEFQIQHVKKPGDLILTGIIIRRKNLPVAPCYYIDDDYTKHLNGTPIADIASRIVSSMKSSLTSSSDIDVTLITDFNKAKDYIIPRLIDIRPGRNDGYLKDRVCTPITGTQIGIIYDIDLSNAKSEMTVGVKKDMLELWGITPDELHELAIANGPRLRPAYFNDLFSMLSELEPLPFPESEPDTMLFVLTTKGKAHGASVILYPSTVEMLNNRFGENNFYILMSSVHELIICRTSLCDDPGILKEMVMSINASEVLPADQLADDVFTLDSSGNLIIAD